MKSYFSFVFSCLLIIQVNAQTGGETCATATVIPSIPYQATGNTSTASDDYFASCQDVGNPGGAKDLVYEYTNGSSDVYVTISLCQAITDYDCQVYVYQGNCTGTPVGCQEDGCQSPAYGAAYNSSLVAQLFLANTTYYIIVDGYDGGSSGNYQLNIFESVGINPPAATNIPLVLIDTFGEQIVDEPKIITNMKIIDNGAGALNHPNDPPNGYSGYAGVEIRGSYSASLPQKPYGVETWDINSNNNNVSLLGMPIENDWILLPNYNDKTFLRNILAFDLFTKMGHYAPRTQLTEVVVNDIYQGIYVFTEKIKRDNNRVDIAKLDLDDNAGDSLTGGYIFKIDYWDNSNSWPANYDNPNFPGSPVRFVYDYPDVNTITSQQNTYLKNTVKDFEDALWGPNFTDPVLGYRSHIDVQSFIDYFIVNEFARNVDGFKKSRRFHKDKDSNNPLIIAGPVWDFDWAYKDLETAYSNGAGWMHNYSGSSDVKPPGWYIRLIQDTIFANELVCSYFTYRQTFLDKTNLFAYIDSLALILDGPQARHFDRWPILGVNVGTPEIGTQPTSYAGEITKFKAWISNRIDWMDVNMPGQCVNLGTTELTSKEPYWNVYPNPSHNEFNVYVDQGMKSIAIYDLSGKLVQFKDVNGATIVQTQTNDLKGVYFLKIQLEDGRMLNTKIVCQ